ncbi:hypothetical protein GF325_16020 [Candidatus Bathyarchaeota archaeon]|nr:hypothetical protein [Candidatus Bathyarchaeota archaeon]
MADITSEEISQLPRRFDTIPYATFFKLWYALQKALPEDEKPAILTRIGRTIGKQFDDSDIETIEDFLSSLQRFLEVDWAITDNARVEIIKDDTGEPVKLVAKQDSCKMCFANTYYRHVDGGSPSCMFPQVMMGVLSRVRRKFGFKKLRYEGVQKGGVGVCQMSWNLA